MFPFCSIGVKPRDETIPAVLAQPLSAIRTMPSPSPAARRDMAGRRQLRQMDRRYFWRGCRDHQMDARVQLLVTRGPATTDGHPA